MTAYLSVGYEFSHKDIMENESGKRFLEDNGDLIYCNYIEDDDDIKTYSYIKDQLCEIDDIDEYLYVYIPHEPLCITSAYYHGLNTCPIPTNVPKICYQLEDIGFTDYETVLTLRLDEDR